MFNFTRSDPKGKCAKCTMGGCMAVATDNCHAWQCAALFWADDMNDALARIAHRVERDTEILGISAHHIDLLGRYWVSDR